MNFLNHKLPPHNNGTINVTVRYIGEIQNVSVDSTISSQSVGSLLDALQKKQPGFSVRKFLGYFKLTKEKELLDDKDSNVEIELEYSLVAWDLATGSEEPHPKVAYLARRKGTWADSWVIFDNNDDDVDIKVVPYVPGSPYRYLKIRHRCLPDPLIGDC